MSAPAGFIYLPSFAHSYNVTGSREDLRQALAAAEATSWAFNPNSQCLRTFEGWMPRAPKFWSAQIVIIGAWRTHCTVMQQATLLQEASTART